MNLPKSFEEYLDLGIIKKSFVDKSRAEFLINETQNSLGGLNERLEKVGIKDNNANSIIKDCYDLLMELVRAKMLLDGFNASGAYAHEAGVSYLQKLNFPELEVYFLNEMRYFRNSATYYGKILSKEYAEKVVDFFRKLYPKLKSILK